MPRPLNLNPICYQCGVVLSYENASPSWEKHHRYICRPCVAENARNYRKAHPEEARRKANKIRQKWLLANKERMYSVTSAYHQRLKQEVMEHYCNGKIHCQNLNCAVMGSMVDIRTLSIDHKFGNGNKHRRFLKGVKGGQDFYRWLKKNNYPEGYQVLCMNCQFIKKYSKDDVN